MKRSFLAVGLVGLVAVLSGALAFGADAKEQVVALQVTRACFVPAEVKVKAGQPVALKITRTEQRTCGTEIVIAEHGVDAKLPLNEPVAVRFTPKKSGELRYGCAMNKMIGGVLTVQ